MKKEAITHGILEDLANRNDNWDKLDGVPEKVVELDESRLILKNEIVNGDFSDGISGFDPSLGVEYEVVNNELHITKFANALKVVALGQKAVSGKYYIKAAVKGEAGKVRMVYTGTDAKDNLSTDDWETLSILASPNELNLIRIMELSDGSLRGTTPIEPYKIKEVTAINLTQTFGAGNEPTKEEMDIIMDTIGYFNGEHTITSKEQFNILLKMVRENALATTSLGGGF